MTINLLLPCLFCSLPVVVALLIFVAIPPSARLEYLKRLNDSAIDWIILGLGSVLFLGQLWLSWRAMQWNDKKGKFNDQVDEWLSHTAQAAEWFPLLGLIGTVAAILQTFSTFGPGTKPAAEEIIQKYGPAITATGSGLFMAFLNILPSWIVITARKLIQSLAGGSRTADEVPLVPVTPASPMPTNDYFLRGPGAGGRA
jgi:hypothetical protein